MSARAWERRRNKRRNPAAPLVIWDGYVWRPVDIQRLMNEAWIACVRAERASS